MSLIQGLPGYVTATSSVVPGIGLKKTGFQSPVLVGRVADGGTSGVGPLPLAGGVICVQSTASLLNQVVTTSDTTLGARASFIYIPVTTGPLVGSAAPPYLGVGTPLVWNDNAAVLMVWSSSRVSWLSQTVTSSALLVDAKGFTSS
jgi:hypothetical protein